MAYPSTFRTVLAVILGFLVAGAVLPTGGGPVWAAPLFKAPFPCGQSWTASTYVGHSNNNNAVDFNLYPGQSDLGQPALASAPGTAHSFWDNLGGNMVEIDHGGGWKTWYAHLATVSINNPIDTGEQIGTVGNTTGSGSISPHLHYEQRLNGVAQPVAFDGQVIPVGTSYTSNDPKTTSTNCGVAPGSPIGHVDDVRGLTGGGVWIRGWVMDPDVKTQPTSLHVYLDGPAGSGAPGKNLGLANFDRPDVAAAYPGSSADHGFNSGFMGVAPGNHTLYVYGINVDGTAGSNVLLGQVAVSVPGTAAGSPLGNGDAATGAIAASKVAGWAFDPDTPQTAVEIHAYVDGAAGTGARGLSLGRASTSRPDVAKAYPAAGPNHGFDTAVTGLSPGPHTIFLYAINAAGGGENPLIGIMTATSPSGSPVGFLDGVRDAGAAIRITGWAVDPDLATKGLEIHAYVNGPAGDSKARGVNLGYATVARPDVAKVHPGAGPAHGFDVTIKEPALGTHVVYVYAIDAKAPGNNVLLGSKTVTVTEPKVPVAPPVDQPTSSASLGSVQRLRAKRLGRSAVVVRWQHVPGHTAYRVRILRPSKRAWVSTTKNHLRVATKATRIKVAIRAVGQTGQGPVVRRTIRVAARSR